MWKYYWGWLIPNTIPPWYSIQRLPHTVMNRIFYSMLAPPDSQSNSVINDFLILEREKFGCFYIGLCSRWGKYTVTYILYIINHILYTIDHISYMIIDNIKWNRPNIIWSEPEHLLWVENTSLFLILLATKGELYLKC